MRKDLDVSQISNIYSQTSQGNCEDVYDNWAQSYDADNAALGFRLPALASAFAARHIAPDAEPILDAGAGTGQVGSALKALGYSNIIGCDISAQMLAIAARTNAYRQLRRQTLGERLEFSDNTFAGVLCIGSFGPGHAPPDTLDELVRVARPGSPVIFNLREDTWKAQGFATKMREISDAKLWTLLEEKGPFRPYIIGEPELYTRIFVFRVN